MRIKTITITFIVVVIISFILFRHNQDCLAEEQIRRRLNRSKVN